MPIADTTRGLRDTLSGKNVDLDDGDKFEEFLLGYDQGTLKVHVTNDVAAPLGDVDRDVDIFLVGRNGHLCRIDVEIDEAVVEIERTQRLEVGRELRFGVSIRARDEGEESCRIELEVVQQFVVVERDVPYDVDLPDLRDDTLRNLEFNRNPVAFERCDRTRHLRTVLALRKVRTMQFLLHQVECRSVEDPPFRESHLLEGGQEVLGLEGFVARELDAAYGGPFDHRHHERLAVAFKPHVSEETGPEQRSDGPGGARAVHPVPHLDWKIVEYGAGGDSPQAFQADVLYDERVDVRSNPHCGTQQDCGKGNAETNQIHHQ